MTVEPESSLHDEPTKKINKKMSKLIPPDWIPPERKGVFLEIPKDQLKLDIQYQRSTKEARTLWIRNHWSWVACGVLTVVQRVDGSFFIVDGGHRYMAAVKKPDIESLPCMVFEMTNLVEEARAFLLINRERKAIPYPAQWKALLVAGDQTALFIEQLIESADRVATNTPVYRAVRCLSCLHRWVEKKQGRQALTDIFPLLDELCGIKPMSHTLVNGLMQLQIEMRKINRSLNEPKIYRRMIDLGLNELIKAAQASSGYHGNSNATTIANGMRLRFNKGQQHIRLPEVETRS